MTPAERWGRALDRSMKRAGIRQFELAKELGIHTDSLINWRLGKRLANLHDGLRVAAFLKDDALASMLRHERTRTCETCGCRFLAVKKQAARFCSKPSCRGANIAQRRSRRDAEVRLGHQRRASVTVRVYRDAVERMCWACEPEGLCRMASCELRGVSPLRLADERLRVA